LRYPKTKQQLVDDNEQATRITLYLPQLHAQKEKLEADLQELEHLALLGRALSGSGLYTALGRAFLTPLLAFPLDLRH
jgi:hypothetical protein